MTSLGASWTSFRLLLLYIFRGPAILLCIANTMKHKIICSLTGILALLGLFACSSQPQMDGRSSADSSLSMAQAPAERPGLATGWGHEKTSRVTNQEFVRNSSKPAGVDAIYYNDPEGIKAMSHALERVNGLQRAAGGLVEWGIKGRLGLLPAYKDRDHGRRLVAGAMDSTYSIVVRNRSRSTLEVLTSVDGLDVMDGKAASYGKRGYLVEPGATLEIDGFRTSYSSVAAFKFSSVSNSYANLRHGDTRNIGVIGLAVFTQQGVNPWTWMPAEVERRNRATPFATPPR